MDKNIVVFGLGYVGASISVLLATRNNVIAIDIDEKRVERINKRHSPIQDDYIKNYLENENLKISATSNVLDINKDTDLFIIATPTNYDEITNKFDTSSVESVVKKIYAIKQNAKIILKSTLPIGFTSNIQSRYPSLVFIFSPEFLREGSALHDNLYPNRIIIGGNKIVGEHFASLLEESSLKDYVPKIFMSFEEAESVKLFSNSYLAMRVAYFNELDTFAMEHGLSSKNIIDGVCLDDRIGAFYNNPSFGYGGYCFPKDTKQLLNNYKNIPEKLITAIVESNDTRKSYISDKIISLNPSTVGIFKLAMKSGSDNFREAAIIDICNKISNEGIKIILYEPSVSKTPFENMTLVNDLCVFKSESDYILVNRLDAKLNDVAGKIITRDVYNNN
jgi:UDPglucose 6-dehydrogenase